LTASIFGKSALTKTVKRSCRIPVLQTKSWAIGMPYMISRSWLTPLL
jgi:hypothetical protein